MTLYEFNRLSSKEKILKIWEGHCIGFREEKDYTVQLYEVEKVHIEVYISKEENPVIYFEPVTSKDRLDLFVKNTLDNSETTMV